MSNCGFNIMSEEEMKAFAIKNIDISISDYTLTGIELNEEYSNRNAQEYLGEVLYEEGGDKVSSIFAIIVYKNGTYDFEWR